MIKEKDRMLKEQERMLREQEYTERQVNHDVIVSDFDSKEPLLQAYFGANTLLEDVRRELQHSLNQSNFNFVSKKGIPMSERSKTVGKAISNKNEIFLRFNKGLPKEVDVFSFENQKPLMRVNVSWDSSLDDVMRIIQMKVTGKYDFVDELGILLLGDFKVSELKGALFIKKNIERDREKKRTENQVEIKKLITEISEFQIKRKQGLSGSQNFDKIREKLESINSVYKYKTNEQILSQMATYRRDLRHSMNYSDPLVLNEDNTTLKQLSELFAGLCQPYYLGKPIIPHSNAIDMTTSFFSIDNQNNNFQYLSSTFLSNPSYEAHLKRWEHKKHLSEANNLINDIFWVVKTKSGFELGDDNQFIIREVGQTSFTITHSIGYYCGGGIKIDRNSAVLSEQIKKDFRELLNFFIASRIPAEKLKSKIIDFFSLYGFELEFGNYYFGGTFELINTVSFKRKQGPTEAANISNLETNVVIEGGGLYGAIRAAGGLEHIFSERRILSDGIRQQKVEYEVNSAIDSVPVVDKMRVWKEKCMNEEKQWRIIGKKVKKTLLLSILKRDRQLLATDQAQLEVFDDFIQFCEETYLEHVKMLRELELQEPKERKERKSPERKVSRKKEQSRRESIRKEPIIKEPIIKEPIVKEQKRNKLLSINLKKDSLRDINEELSALSNLRAVTHLSIDFVPITTFSGQIQSDAEYFNQDVVVIMKTCRSQELRDLGQRKVYVVVSMKRRRVKTLILRGNIELTQFVPMKIQYFSFYKGVNMKRRRVRKWLFSGIHQDIQGLLVDIQWQLLNNPYDLAQIISGMTSLRELRLNLPQGLYNDDWWIALADAIKSLPHIQIVRVRTLKGYDHDSDNWVERLQKVGVEVDIFWHY